MSKIYTPNAGSVADRVCAYFLANPSEELEPYFISLKFGVSNKFNVKTQLAQAVEVGYLVTARNTEGEIVYGPGPKIDLLRPVTEPPSKAPAKHIPAKRGQIKGGLEDYSTPYVPTVPTLAQALESSVSTNPDPVAPNADPVSQTGDSVSQSVASVAHPDAIGLDAFVIEDGIPLPPIHSQGGRTAQMRALLDKLKPGQSVQLSMRFHAVLAHSQAIKHKASQGKFTMRTDRKTDMLRVWRVA